MLTLLSVKDHSGLVNGHRTRFWCCQDEAHKKRSRPTAEDKEKRRDNLGMSRFDCESKLIISSRTDKDGSDIIAIRMCHLHPHIPYYDVSLPSGATEIIRENLEWSTPSSLVGPIQEKYPHVTAQQIHKAWTTMSEILWKRDQDQMVSAKLLLEKMGDDVDVFNAQAPDGVKLLCWGMKKIAESLQGKVVEVGLDATCTFSSTFQIGQ